MTANPGGGDYRPDEAEPCGVCGIDASLVGKVSCCNVATAPASGEVRFECPSCGHVAPWTDGMVKSEGDERDEFWCQRCGTESALDDCTEVTPASVAQDATDATETPARTPGGSGTAEARRGAQGETDAAGMDNQGAQIEAWRTRALTAEADARRLTGVVAELRAQVARVEKVVEALTILGNLPIEERPDGLTASVKACTAIAGDLRAALDDA